MLKPRTVIVFAVIVAAVSLVVAVIDLAAPPDRDGLGADSYGTYSHGYRALYELTSEMGLGSDRALAPPTAFHQPGRCLVFLGPDPALVHFEPEYLRHTADWIYQGGSVMIAPRRKTGRYHEPMGLGGDFEDLPGRGGDAMAELGLTDVRVDSFERIRAESKGESPPPESDDDRDRADSQSDRPGALFRISRIETRVVDIEAAGRLEELGNLARNLEVPGSQLQVIDAASTRTPAGCLFFRDDRGTSYVLAAEYDQGTGRAILVSDPRMFRNSLLSSKDNAVAAAHLLARGGGRIAFDEFYHGLTIRGNPLWLLTRPPYTVLAVLLALAAGVWVWRQGVALGPPLPERIRSRRSILEYVEAMAGLFSRRNCRRFVAEEVLGGSLWLLRRRFGLPERGAGVEEIARAMERKDPERADRVRRAVAAAQVILHANPTLSAREVVEIARSLIQCL